MATMLLPEVDDRTVDRAQGDELTTESHSHGHAHLGPLDVKSLRLRVGQRSPG